MMLDTVDAVDRLCHNPKIAQPAVEKKLRRLADAVALILILDDIPNTQIETVDLAPKTREQLRAALGLEK